MRVSRRTDYALRVLFALVAARGGQPVSIRDLAGANDVPRRFLEHIVLELKAAGWVTSVQGKRGGYLLAVPPASITLGQVVRRFGGPLAPLGCVSVTAPERCSQEATCAFRRVFGELRDHAARLLDRTTLDDVISGRPLVSEE